MWHASAPSPIGVLLLVANDVGLVRVEFPAKWRTAAPGCPDSGGPLSSTIRQLAEYFVGHRKQFDLPLAPRGTAFQLEVWRALLRIPYGETRSYADIARSIGRPTATRAVGAANGANPIPIIIPCHRVIGTSGALTGFGGGIAVKRRLLDLESGVTPMSFRAP